MAIGTSFVTVVEDTVFDGTAAGDVSSSTVAGNTHDLTGALAVNILLHADSQAGTPADNIRFDIYTGILDSSAVLEITPSDSVTLNLVAASGGVDPNSKYIQLFPVPHYVHVKATRVGSTDTIRCHVRLEMSQGNPSAA